MKVRPLFSPAYAKSQIKRNNNNEEQEAAKYNNIFFLLSPGEALNELECTYRLAISYFYA